MSTVLNLSHSRSVCLFVFSIPLVMSTRQVPHDPLQIPRLIVLQLR